MKLFENWFSKNEAEVPAAEQAAAVRLRISSLEQERDALTVWMSQDSSARRQDEERLKEIEQKIEIAKKELETVESVAA